MALIREISLGISVNSKDFAAKLKSAEAQLGRFGKAATLAGASLASLETARGAATALKNAVDRAADLETTLAGLSKATDLEGKALGSLKDQLFALSTELKGVKLDDLLAIATTGAKLGVASNDILEYTRGVAMLSTAMDDVPAETIADQVGKINVVFKLGVKGALQIGSAIDKLADSGASSAADILDVTQRTSGLAEAMHLTADQAVSLAAALLDTGTHAEAGAGALNMLLGAIVRVENHKAFAAAIGTGVAEFSALVKTDAAAAIEQFLGALKKLDANTQLKVLDSIGINADRGATNIQKLAQQTDAFHGYLAMAAREFATLNQITQSYAKTAATTNAAWDQFHNRVDVIAETFGSTFLPVVNAGLDGIGGRLGEINSGAAALKETLAGIELPPWASELLKGGAEFLGDTAIDAALGGGGAAVANGLGLFGRGGAKPAVPNAPGAAKKAAATAKAAGDSGAEASAAFGARKLADDVKDLNDKLDLEAETLGKTSAEIEIYKLQQAGATENELGWLRIKQRDLELMEERAAGTKKFEAMTAALEADIAAMDSGADVATKYKLALEGMSLDQEDSVAALLKQRDALEDAKAIMEETRTPLERYNAELAKLEELRAGGAIGQEAFDRKKAMLAQGLEGDGPKFAGALTAGSTEAYSAQLRFAAMGQEKTDEPIKEVAKKTGEQVDLTKQMLTGINKLVEKAGSAVGGAIGELFAI